MGMKDYARILRRSWFVIAAATLIGVLAAWAVTAMTTPQYSATSAAFVSSDRGGTLNDLTQGNAFTERRVNTYAQLVTEPIVTAPVIEEFGLEGGTSELASRIKVTIPVETTMVEITVTDPSAEVASSLANALVTSLTTVVQQIEPLSSTVAPDGTVIESAPIVKITQVRFADVPEAPVSPRLWFNLLVGLLAGIALGVLAAILREMLDTRLRTPEDIERLTPIPVVGIVPQLAKGRSTASLGSGEPGDTFDEAFRILRTNLQFLEVGGPSTFVITSSTGGEGKSTVTANLAAAIAANGLRVLVVDADLRRPQVHMNFGVEGGAGLTDVLIGRASLEDVVQPWQSDRLHVLASGRIPPNPSELLGSAPMHELMKRVEQEYDVVLYDSAPVLPVPDAAILSHHVGGVLVVASVGRAALDQVGHALNALARVNANVSGVVVNRMTMRGSAGYLREAYQSRDVQESGESNDQPTSTASVGSGGGDASPTATDANTASAEESSHGQQGADESLRRRRRVGAGR